MNASATTSTAEDVFERYFAELDKRAIPYVILHSYDRYPQRIDSDVDYAVMETDRQAALDAHETVAQSCGWVVAQRVDYEIFATSVLLVAPSAPASFLRLDVTSHLTRNSCFYFPDRFLLEGKRRHGEFLVPSPAAEFNYILVKTLAKTKDPGDALPRLRALWSRDPRGIQAAFTGVFGMAAGSPEKWFDRSPQRWQELRSLLDTRHRYRLSHRLAECRRYIRRVRQPVGLRIAILGPDGVGKSLLIAELEKSLKPCFHKQQVFHFCPRFLLKRTSNVVTRPHAQPARNAVAGHLKVIYYFVDHWLGFLFQQWPAVIRRNCVVFDRDFDDLLIDPRRYRLRDAAWMVRLLRRLLPPFDVKFILDADPVVAHQRKPELPLEELQRQRAVLHALAATDSRFVIIPAGGTAAEVSRNTAGKVIEFMAQRERRRNR